MGGCGLLFDGPGKASKSPVENPETAGVTLARKRRLVILTSGKFAFSRPAAFVFPVCWEAQ